MSSERKRSTVGGFHIQCAKNENPERRVNLQAAPNKKSFEGNLAVRLILAKKEARNEKPAQNEEQLNPDPAARGKRRRDCV